MTPPPATAEAARPEVIAAGLPKSRPAWIERATSADHKSVGTMYIATALVFGLLALTELAVIRLQLLFPDSTVLRPEIFDRFMTAYGTTAVVLFLLPLALGLFSHIVPLQIGARSTALPRLGQLSYWLFLFGGIVFYLSFLWRPSEAGVLALPPLSDDAWSANHGVDHWIAGVALCTLGFVCFAVNMIATLRTQRAPGMAWRRMPLFSWAATAVSSLLLFVGPVMLAALTMLMLDRHAGGVFFDPTEFGSPILYEHLAWIFFTGIFLSIVIAFFGAISEIVATFSGRPQFMHRAAAYSLAAVAGIGVLAWMQNMYTAPMPIGFSYFAMLFALALIVPFGIIIFNWLATLRGGEIRLRAPMVFALGAISVATWGLLGEMMQSMIPVNLQLAGTGAEWGDTHYVLIGAGVFGGFAALYYWLPKLTGRSAGEGVAKASFAALFVGTHMMILPVQVAGLEGMPADVYKYFGDTGLTGDNVIASIGGFLFVAGAAASIINLARGAVAGIGAGPDPWTGTTLEWFAPSPPPPHNFDVVPDVRSAEPLADIRDAVRARKPGKPVTAAAATPPAAAEAEAAAEEPAPAPEPEPEAPQAAPAEAAEEPAPEAAPEAGGEDEGGSEDDGGPSPVS